jgi:hypothetical protein
MEQAKRFNQGKLNWNLLPWSALEPGVRVFMFGSEKYGDFNYMKGLPVRDTCDSLLRHVFAYMGGEDNDLESGLPHLGHAFANIVFLLNQHTQPEKYSALDNRQFSISKEQSDSGIFIPLDTHLDFINISTKDKKVKIEVKKN